MGYFIQPAGGLGIRKRGHVKTFDTDGFMCTERWKDKIEMCK